MIDSDKVYDFLNGEILVFDKNIGWTSFDLVQVVRNTLCKKMGIKKLKVGHAGTLDPLATGLMILCTGKATKQIEFLQFKEKEYLATLKIGATTPSFDLETEENEVKDYSKVTQTQLENVLLKFKGETEQIPPVFSAVKVNGKRAFSYARNGEDLELKPKKIIISNIEIETCNFPEVQIRVSCSKGTYIRSLANDIGKELGCGAYLTGLRRTKIGEYNIENTMTIDYFLENISTFVTN